MKGPCYSKIPAPAPYTHAREVFGSRTFWHFGGFMPRPPCRGVDLAVVGHQGEDELHRERDGEGPDRPGAEGEQQR